ncbi:MAG TPA: DUF2933 domain-containing protein [Burkholderiales bacterium]|nr:DUF2933 domain-containing protein [Burkholderiales bacterium]
MNGHRHEHDANRDAGIRIPTRWVLIGFAAIAGYFLLAEHRAHAIQFLPWLLLLACPLLHLFHGHGGHGGHGRPRDGADEASPRRDAAQDLPRKEG